MELCASWHLDMIELSLSSLDLGGGDSVVYIGIVDFGAILALENGVDVQKTVVSSLVVLPSLCNGMIGIDVTSQVSE